jgi:serine/threonine protein phosphatase PrpC
VVKLLQNIFGNQNSQFDEDRTTPLVNRQSNKDAKLTNEYYPMQMIVGTAQSVGKQRDHNEDALFAFSSSMVEAESEHIFGLFIIADGMGGHQHGEVASGTAMRIFSDFLIDHLYKPNLVSNERQENLDIQNILQEGVQKVQETVLKTVPGGGTTLTAAVVSGEKVIISHVGDSRAYFIFPDGRIEPLTHDHSLVQRLVDLGEITEDEAQEHNQRNVLYRAIGQNEPFEPDIKEFPLPLSGYMLLCSDGLWGQVAAEKIKEIVLATPNLSLACNRLVGEANLAGGPDNISAILVKFVDRFK